MIRAFSPDVDFDISYNWHHYCGWVIRFIFVELIEYQIRTCWKFA